jgi:hypothetical protein
MPDSVAISRRLFQQALPAWLIIISANSSMARCRRFSWCSVNPYPSDPKPERQAVLTVVEIHRIRLNLAAEVKRASIITALKRAIPDL